MTASMSPPFGTLTRMRRLLRPHRHLLLSRVPVLPGLTRWLWLGGRWPTCA